jgi:hypothetical protein
MFQPDVKKITPEAAASLFKCVIFKQDDKPHHPYFSWKNEMCYRRMDGKQKVDHEYAYNALKRMLGDWRFYLKHRWARAIIYELMQGREIYRVRSVVQGTHLHLHTEHEQHLTFEDRKTTLGFTWNLWSGIKWYISPVQTQLETIDVNFLRNHTVINKKFWDAENAKKQMHVVKTEKLYDSNGKEIAA